MARHEPSPAGDEWIFQEIEGLLWHVLLHTEEVDTTNPYVRHSHLSSSLKWMTHGNVARLWSLANHSFLTHGRVLDVWTTEPLPYWVTWSAEHVDACINGPGRPVAPLITWSRTGVISKCVKVMDRNTKAAPRLYEEDEGTEFIANLFARKPMLSFSTANFRRDRRHPSPGAPRYQTAGDKFVCRRLVNGTTIVCRRNGVSVLADLSTGHR